MVKARGFPMMIGEAVRKRIIQLCKERNLSINKLCTICGITQSTVNNIVSGRNNSVTISTIKKICDGLEISVLDFLMRSYFGIWSRKYDSIRPSEKRIFPILICFKNCLNVKLVLFSQPAENATVLLRNFYSTASSLYH